jgi:hypothetical protein
MEEKGRNYRGYVGSTDKASLLNLSRSSVLPRVGRKKPIRAHWLDHGRSPVWPVPVTGLTGDDRPQPVAPTVKISSLLPLSPLSLLSYSPAFTLSKTANSPPPLSFNPPFPHGDLKIQPRKRLKIGSKRISQGPSSLSHSSSLDSTQVPLSKGIQIFFLPDLFTWCKDLNFLW